MKREYWIKEYKSFMQIDSFPDFDVEYFVLDAANRYTASAKAEYDPETRRHILHLPSNYEIDRFILFHEFTHIYDAEMLSTGKKEYDFFLTGYMEYHASQIELLEITDKRLFSMKSMINDSSWSIQDYINNKFETAVKLMESQEETERLHGVGVLFNFFGLKDICERNSADFIDDFGDITKLIGSYLYYLKETMSGQIKDIKKVVGLYSQIVAHLLRPPGQTP